MAVSRRAKASDVKYTAAIGTRPPLTEDSGMTGREYELEDVIEDLRDDVNAISDLANLVEGFTFTYTASPDGGRTPARLTITHVASRTNFTIDA